MKDEIGFLGDKILEYRFEIVNEVYENRIDDIIEEEKNNWFFLKWNLLIFEFIL